MLHHQLPSPFSAIVSHLVLDDVHHADWYLLGMALLLTICAFVQLKAFARPPPVPLKVLPRRPALQILFKPDDIFSTQANTTTATSTDSTTSPGGHPPSSSLPLHKRRPSEIMRSVSQSIFRSSGLSVGSGKDGGSEADAIDSPTFPSDDEHLDSGYNTEEEDLSRTKPTTKTTESPFLHSHDLPDSFAPLLSSSQMEVLCHQLTADLIHAIQLSGEVRLHEGSHEIPLDQNPSRPQLRLDIPKGGCRTSIQAQVGSDGCSSEEDLNVGRKTATRSKPMVKHTQLTIDPPLPLANVAPTLIHFPTLFEDKFVPTLRRLQIVRWAIDLVTSLSSFIEKVLWIIEQKCQIHLGQVSIHPIYKGSLENQPEWRLRLAFSGHVLLFGWIPIPFVGIILPTFIIPHPHALLENLLTAQPLASAKLKGEKFDAPKIALAALQAVQEWNIECKAVATPPALGVDLTFPGGVAVALELLHGRDPGVRKSDLEAQSYIKTVEESNKSVSANSMSSWTTYENNMNASTSNTGHLRHRRAGGSARGSGKGSPTAAANNQLPPFDANQLVPWFLEVAAKGTVHDKKLTLHLVKLLLQHDDSSSPTASSKFSTSGSFAVWKADLQKADLSKTSNSSSPTSTHRRSASYGHLMALSSSVDAPSVAEVLLFPEKTKSLSRAQKVFRMLQYDYAFDVWDDSQIDALTLSVGASHPMLKGGHMVTTILESIYAFGSVTAREGAMADPTELARKRNILRHLPAVDFTFGIQNVFIPLESLSYSDDGQTKCTPELENGRMMIRIIGGSERSGKSELHNDETNESRPEGAAVSDGIKLIADIGVGALALNNESQVKEFPELDIFEGTKLVSLLSGELTARISSHLRPQILSKALTTTGPNIFNPLEAFEIDFSGSSLSFKIKESTATLGHRRVIIPTESIIIVKVNESIVDMAFEGKTDCELSWDFQGLSPILQATAVGESPARADHENKEQVALLIAPLRQGRLNLNVSAVGGIAIAQAKTARDDREGLYDWKFFNAIVSPDEGSSDRLLEVLHDRRTMEKLLQVVKLINADLHKILRYILTQAWRAKDIFDQEGVSDPGHAIPKYKMARLFSLFLCGDASQVEQIIPIIQRVVAGEGLDIVKMKELLRLNLDAYDDWAPEIDRAVRWTAEMLGPMVAKPPYVEAEVPPLSQLRQHAARFRDIPSARELYNQIHDKMQLPLDRSFSNLVSHVAPYLSLNQIEYFLKVRASTDWQPSDLRRLRYVYSVKRKVQEISESYGGISFLPQSFLVSVFLGEATRASLRAVRVGKSKRKGISRSGWSVAKPTRTFTLRTLRQRRTRAPRHQNSLDHINEGKDEGEQVHFLTPAGRIASRGNFVDDIQPTIPDDLILDLDGPRDLRTIDIDSVSDYELGDSLLGPQDVAILLQAGLASAMKGSTVVQLNQRMILDLIASQPNSFAVAVLAEIGTPGGQGSPRGLTSALMALLELDQSSFTEMHRLDMHALLESWLPGFKIPRREDYLAGGRWARQSFYEAIFGVATNILEDAECYMALKGHVQRARTQTEADPIPRPKEEGGASAKLRDAISSAKRKIENADKKGSELLRQLLEDERKAKSSDAYKSSVAAYQDAFAACAEVRNMDKLAFHADWFKDFYRRNYDALMIKSVYDNVIDNVDQVRNWLNALRRGPKLPEAKRQDLSPSRPATHSSIEGSIQDFDGSLSPSPDSPYSTPVHSSMGAQDNLFSDPSKSSEQTLIDAILDALIYRKSEREMLRRDPLVRLLIPNPPGRYNFAIVTAMGVITEGKSGLELDDAFRRLREQRGVALIRADTATARSFEFNASKIEEAIATATELGMPYGLLGYSQGCANALTAESLLLSGSPAQQQALVNPQAGLVCRQLLFSAANGSMHGPATDLKVQRLIVMCEEFFKYQQGYFSRAFTSTVLESLNGIMDSAAFHKFIGGAQSMLPDGSRVFWREAQHLPHIPTCTLRGVLEEHTTPECLEMISNLLTKQSGSSLHDSQVHVYDAVGYPVYTNNRNGRILKNCSVGAAAIQRTHHWSPLSDEVEFVRTQRDIERSSFDCAKDRHVFPWVDVNVRFGFIRYMDGEEDIVERETVNQLESAQSEALAEPQSTPGALESQHQESGGGPCTIS